jgi:hypothetical protein
MSVACGCVGSCDEEREKENGRGVSRGLMLWKTGASEASAAAIRPTNCYATGFVITSALLPSV